MARSAKFTHDDILDAAVNAVSMYGREATIAQVAVAADAPVGSIYHRFQSREELFVSAWLRAIQRFHVGYLLALDHPDPTVAAVACAVHIPRFGRDHPAEAEVMTMYRQPELALNGPASLNDEIVHVNDDVNAALLDLASRRFPSSDDFNLALISTACQESPYGLIRRYLGASIRIPPWMDGVVEVSTAAILALGDSSRDQGADDEAALSQPARPPIS